MRFDILSPMYQSSYYSKQYNCKWSWHIHRVFLFGRTGVNLNVALRFHRTTHGFLRWERNQFVHLMISISNLSRSKTIGKLQIWRFFFWEIFLVLKINDLHASHDSPLLSSPFSRNVWRHCWFCFVTYVFILNLNSLFSIQPGVIRWQCHKNWCEMWMINKKPQHFELRARKRSSERDERKNRQLDRISESSKKQSDYKNRRPSLLSISVEFSWKHLFAFSIE